MAWDYLPPALFELILRPIVWVVFRIIGLMLNAIGWVYGGFHRGVERRFGEESARSVLVIVVIAGWAAVIVALVRR